MATPLTDGINALTTYANEVTGKEDATLSDAVRSLVEGYGGGGGSGASAWTKVAETSYQVSTTDTKSTTVDTWETGHSELWTSNKWMYVRIRDTAGKRAGYFYGSDIFFANNYAKNGVSGNVGDGMLMKIWRYTSDGQFFHRYGYDTTGYGIFADNINNNGGIRIRCRYSSSYSLTIDGTYKVEVYLLDPAGGVPIFE